MNKDWRKLTELERLLYRELFKKDCYSFCKEFWSEIESTPLVEGRILQFFCEVFQYASRYWVDYKEPKIILPELKTDDVLIDVRENKHLFSISCPPRHGKSDFFNVLCPVWLFVNSPIKVASVSHTQNLAGTMNQKRQKLLNSDKFKFFFPEIKLETNTTYSLKDSRNGEMYSVPKNAITGFGADYLSIDDLTNVSQAVKDAKEMESAWQTYTEVLPSRINDVDKHVIINIMQRIAPNDIVGRILNEPKLRKSYTFITLPAQFSKHTYIVCPISGKIFEFNIGSYLFPERFGDYSTLKASLTEHTWKAQYLQEPENTDIAVIKTDMIQVKDVNEVPSIDYASMIYASHDFPVKDKETSDYLGSSLAYKVGSNLYIIDCLEKRMDFTKSVNYVKSLDTQFPGIIQVIEDKANGSPILNALQDEIAGMQAFNPGTNSKMQRLESASLYFKNLYFVKTVWDEETKTYKLSQNLENLIKRLLQFPFVEHDDIVDSISMLLLFVYMDRRYMVYGRAFDDNNLIDINKITQSDYSTVFFNKEGDLWKVMEVGVNYGEETKLIVKKELVFKASVNEGLKYLKKFTPEKTVFIDCSITEALRGISSNEAIVERYEIEDFDSSVAMLNLAFSKKHILLNRNCVLTKNDIEMFKFSKSKDENMKYLTTKDGFVACLRVAMKYYGIIS